jgi:hypothetical protein
MIRLSALVLAALLPARFAGAAQKGSDQDKIEMVEYFVKTPVADLPSGHIDEFLAIDPKILPKKLVKKFEAKRFELYTFKQLAESKKKGTLRTPDAACDAPKETKSNDAGILKMTGFEEIFDTELLCVEKETKCTPHDLMCEFSLQIIIEVKKNKKVNRYFLHPNDPIMGVVAQCRDEARVGKQTNFFGVMKPLCQH